MKKKLITVKETSKYLGIPLRTVYRLIKQGKINLRMAGRRMVKAKEIKKGKGSPEITVRRALKAKVVSRVVQPNHLMALPQRMLITVRRPRRDVLSIHVFPGLHRRRETR